MSQDPEFVETANRIADGLRLYVGYGKKFSVTLFADAIGASERQVRKYMAGEATPGAYMLRKMFRTLPPAFANHYLELCNLHKAERILD